MGESKRRREIGLPHNEKIRNNLKTTDCFFSSQFSINKFKNVYPAATFVTTALVLIIFQWGLSLTS